TADNDEHSTGISKVGGSWGAVRYLGNHAFSAALYANLADTDEFDEFIYRQIDFILGKNRRDYSFLVGFDDHGGEMAQKPHHRNVFLNDDNILNESNYNDLLVIPERNKYFGYMVGGHRNPNKYVDDVLDYSSTEGGIDYNAGFLGALAYIVSKVAPADEITPVKISPAKTSFQNSVVRFVGTHEFAAQNKSFTVRVFDLKGNEVSVIKSNGQAVRFTPKSNGIYYATVK
ncbi:MAG: glycoside hydrolase family 9 protein, partial [Fibromonadales bacterium]|nr:glycoside hydrolase family 9 protein [Fibromonadales bacterium]